MQQDLSQRFRICSIHPLTFPDTEVKVFVEQNFSLDQTNCTGAIYTFWKENKNTEYKFGGKLHILTCPVYKYFFNLPNCEIKVKLSNCTFYFRLNSATLEEIVLFRELTKEEFDKQLLLLLL